MKYQCQIHGPRDGWCCELAERVRDLKSFGHFLQAVVLNLHWHEYQNALLICDRAPELIDYLHYLWEAGQTPQSAAELLDRRFNHPGERP